VNIIIPCHGNEIQKSCWWILSYHWMHSNSCIAIDWVCISTFHCIPTGVPQYLFPSLWDSQQHLCFYPVVFPLNTWRRCHLHPGAAVLYSTVACMSVCACVVTRHGDTCSGVHVSLRHSRCHFQHCFSSAVHTLYIPCSTAWTGLCRQWRTHCSSISISSSSSSSSSKSSKNCPFLQILFYVRPGPAWFSQRRTFGDHWCKIFYRLDGLFS